MEKARGERSRKLVIRGAFIAIVFLFWGAFAASAEEINRTEFVLGTVCTVRLVDGGTNATLTAAFDRLRAIEEHMSAK